MSTHSCFCNILATTYQLPHRETRRVVTTGVSNTQETTLVHDRPSQQCANCVALIVLGQNKGGFDLSQFLNIPSHDIVDKCMTQHDSSVDFEQRRKPVFMCGNKHCRLYVACRSKQYLQLRLEGTQANTFTCLQSVLWSQKSIHIPHPLDTTGHLQVYVCSRGDLGDGNDDNVLSKTLASFCVLN